MKSVSSIFAILMFAVLFVAPLTLSVLQDDVSIVLQEFEDSSDAEEGEDIKLKEAQEKLFWTCDWSSDNYTALANIQIHIERLKHVFASQQLGVETPPPRLS